MPKEKKRTMQFTETEILAFTSVIAEIMLTGHIEEGDDLESRKWEQAAEVFTRFATLADIICKLPAKDAGEMYDAALESIGDRYYSHPKRTQPILDAMQGGAVNDGGLSE